MRTLFAMMLSVLVLGACGGGSRGFEQPPATSTPRPLISSTGSIKIVQPASGEVVRGGRVVVKVEVKGARVIARASTNITPDTGHVHLKLDGRIVTLLAGLEFEIKDLQAGLHVLEAEFSAADHGPFRPRVIATVTFTAE